MKLILSFFFPFLLVKTREWQMRWADNWDLVEVSQSPPVLPVAQDFNTPSEADKCSPEVQEVQDSVIDSVIDPALFDGVQDSVIDPALFD